MNGNETGVVPEKVRLARYSLGVAGFMSLVAAVLFLFVFISGLSAAGRGNGAFQLVRHMLPGTMTLVLFFISGGLGLACFITAPRLSRRRPAGRLTGLALGILLLLFFPFGTVPGVFVVWGLTGKAARDWFRDGPSRGGRPRAGNYSGPSRDADTFPEGWAAGD